MNASRRTTIRKEQADAPWMVDAVVLLALGPEGSRPLPRMSDGSLCIETVNDVRIVLDTRDGARTVRTEGVKLADGIHYSSHHDRSYAATDAQGRTKPVKVHFEPCVRIVGTVPPLDVVLGLAGREIRSVVDHPWLDVPGLTIRRATIDTSNGEPDGMSLILDEVLRPVAPRADES